MSSIIVSEDHFQHCCTSSTLYQRFLKLLLFVIVFISYIKYLYHVVLGGTFCPSFFLGKKIDFSYQKKGNVLILFFFFFPTALVIDIKIALLHYSIRQMSKLYTCIWNEMAASKCKITEELHSEPCIFVPYTSGEGYEDVVSGVFLSSEEVYWHDPTGTVDLMKKMYPQCSSAGVSVQQSTRMLSDVYPGLHEFFVNRCGVHESPSFRSYLEILLQLSTVALPSQVANFVSNLM